MYGTLSFSQTDKRSSAEFRAFPSVHGRRQRQQACDECRRARVKCREKSNGDRCARCHTTNRACTYNSTRHQSRHSESLADSKQPMRLADGTGEDNEGEDGLRAGNPSASSRQVSTPRLQHPHEEGFDGVPDCHSESFDMFIDPGRGTVTDGSSSAGVRQQNDADMNNSSGSMRDNNGGLHLPGLGPASTPVEHNIPPHYDFSALCNDLLPQILLSTPSPWSMPSMASSATTIEHHKSPSLSLDARLDHSTSPPCSNDTRDDATSRIPPLAGFSDLIDVMQFASSASLSGWATSTSNGCACLQDLTANLFSLRSRAEKVQVDHFMLLFKQAMGKWKAAEVCTSACCISHSSALLMLMNVQELVARFLEAASFINTANSASGKRDAILIINMGSFAVEDRADQRFVAQMLLAARMKELHSFISRISSKTKLAGLDDICTEYHHQIELLRKAFSSSS